MERSEETIFAEAVERKTDEDRAAFLDAACAGDPELRKNVESLLEAYAEGEFLESPAPVLAATIDQPVNEKPGTVIGRYKLLEKIAEGGMGVVYVAEQTEPVRRKVALKIIKPGLNSEQVVARFEAERQALALMNHPNVAKVFEGGATDSGRPYFVMELVKGIAITEYCDQCDLTTRERLELFVQVCQAVQHAHLKGIIHRDIKPTNVLVAMQDGRPTPQVIDFGVAKAIAQRLTEHTQVTGFAQMVGTPLYMSPEQAEMSALDVDTRTDVYSLGVLLYELLTGTTPFDQRRLKEATFDEMRRIIREEESPRPSARISTMGRLAATTIAEHRRTHLRKLSHLLRGDLDWIVMKALEKDRTRRYETVSRFAEDVQQYLAEKPVAAGPPSTVYRFRKFVRRNKTRLTIFAAVTLALAAGTFIAAREAIRATDAAMGERKAREEAEAYYAKALDVVEKLLTEVGQKELADVPHFEPVRRRVLEMALDFNESLLAERNNDPRARFETGMAYARVAEIQELLGNRTVADKAYQSGIRVLNDLAQSPDTSLACEQALASAHHKYGSFLAFSGRLREAEREVEHAISLWEALRKQHPDDSRLQRGLAQALVRKARDLGQTNRVNEAEVVARRALNVYDQLSGEFKEHSDLPMEFADAQQCLAAVLAELNRPEESAQTYLAAAAILEKTRTESFNPSLENHLARASHNVGEQLQATGKPREATEQFRQAIHVAVRLVGLFPSVPAYQRTLAASYNSLGYTLIQCEEPDDAEQAFRDALSVHGRLANEYADTPDCQSELAAQLQNLAVVLLMRGKAEEARQRLEQAIEHQNAALELSPQHQRYQRFLRNHYWNLGNALTTLEAFSEAVSATSEAISRTTRLLEEDSENLEYQEDLPKLYSKLGAILNTQALLFRKQSRFDEARELLERAVAEQGRAVELDDRNLTYRRFLRNHYVQLTQTLLSLKAFREAAARGRDLINISPEELVVEDCYDVARWLAQSLAMIDDNTMSDQERTEIAELCAARSVEMLRETIRWGFLDLSRLEKDPLFDPLRPRADFQKVLEELKANIQRRTPE